MTTTTIISGGDSDPLLPQLLERLRTASQIQFAVAFVLPSGLDLIFDAVVEALVERKAKVEILTGDYMSVTDPQALRRLMLLAERGADVRIYVTQGRAFHPKAYLCIESHDSEDRSATAFVGSSNLSRSALISGVEWNARLDFDLERDPFDRSVLEELQETFHSLFHDAQAHPLSHAWIDEYEERRESQTSAHVGVGSMLDGVVEEEDELRETPEPYSVQAEALEALRTVRWGGERRGLVVLATGLGKTWLAAFDVERLRPGRTLFVAHREEILLQAEETFLRIMPDRSVGRYDGSAKDGSADIVFASIQTLARAPHLRAFPPDYFDYIVVDEFHHAAAPTYIRLLDHFEPSFLLGLTATPDRTDQSDILSLCDDNLVYTADLFEGILRELLVPFQYFGIVDETVEYDSIPWRSGRFDPHELSNKLATFARARHVFREWDQRAGERTLAFCVSIKHADFMAQHFRRHGVNAVAVHGESLRSPEPHHMAREKALEELSNGELKVVFSVDLFNEGVDVPSLDTVMMLRPTESKILFQQQLGRGLRIFPAKSHLTVLDFIGNHRAFLSRPQVLLGVGPTNKDLAQAGRDLAKKEIELPPGCFVSFDLEFIDFLRHISSADVDDDYERVRDSLGRRPTPVEFERAGGSLSKVRIEYGGWWELVRGHQDLEPSEVEALDVLAPFLKELETTSMTRSFKAVLIRTWLSHGGFQSTPTVDELSRWAQSYFRSHPHLRADLSKTMQGLDFDSEAAWRSYWKKNPINAWTGESSSSRARNFFRIDGDQLVPTFSVPVGEAAEAGTAMVLEILELRMAQYRQRSSNPLSPSFSDEGAIEESTVALPYFKSLPVACGHFQTGSAAEAEMRSLPVSRYGDLDPTRHFVAVASGRSMDGGSQPVPDGALLLLEHVGDQSPEVAELSDQLIVFERRMAEEGRQYVLRQPVSDGFQGMVLRAANPEYGDLDISGGTRPIAVLRAVVEPIHTMLGEELDREEIPQLFGEEFNPGNWNSGHVVLRDPTRHILLVTLSKKGKQKDHRYDDRFLGPREFQWQSQNQTTPSSKRGRELISHRDKDIPVHLFIRESKLRKGKGAPFTYFGEVDYSGHEGSKPITFRWKLRDAVAPEYYLSGESSSQ
jgi:superfamily II DNA or RNA helicase/HKD family nuclease